MTRPFGRESQGALKGAQRNPGQAAGGLWGLRGKWQRHVSWSLAQEAEKEGQEEADLKGDFWPDLSILLFQKQNLVVYYLCH